MKIFLDTANLEEIKTGLDLGIVDGVTTNPSLAAKEEKSFKEIVPEILNLVNGPVSLEVISTDYDGILDEARKLSQLSENVYVKVPMIPEGIKAVKTLSAEGIKTNVTLVFSAGQALLAAKAGASFVSPFVGRHHDSGRDGIQLIEEIRLIYDNYGFDTEILVASDRTVMDTIDSAMIGADIITMKYDNLLKLFNHPLTTQGLNKFLEDWNNSGQEKLV